MRHFNCWLLATFLLFIVACKKDSKEEEREPVSTPGKISGRVLLPTGSSINVNTLKVLSPIAEAEVNDGKFIIDTLFHNYTSQLILNSTGELIMMHYNYPGQENNDVTVQTTAIAMLMSTPAMQSITDDGKSSIIDKVIVSSAFNGFKEEISKALVAGKSIADTTNISLKNAYIKLFETASAFKSQNLFDEPILIHHTGRVIGFTNNKAANDYVIGIYKDGQRVEQYTIEGATFSATSISQILTGNVIFIGTPSSEQYTFSGDGKFEIKIRSGKPGLGDNSKEANDAFISNRNAIILDIALTAFPFIKSKKLPCAKSIADKLVGTLGSGLLISSLSGSSFIEFANAFYEVAILQMSSATDMIAKCVNIDEERVVEYVKGFSKLFDFFGRVSAVGTGINITARLVYWFNCKPAMDTCFVAVGNSVMSCDKVFRIEKVADGDNQIGEPGKVLPGNLTVKVFDASNKPVEVKLVWSTPNGGYLGGHSASFNGMGISTWQLGPNEGTQTATVKAIDANGKEISGSPITFTATAGIIVRSTAWTGWYKADGWTPGNGCPPDQYYTLQNWHGLPTCTAPMTMNLSEDNNGIITGSFTMWDFTSTVTGKRTGATTLELTFYGRTITVTQGSTVGSKMNGYLPKITHPNGSVSDGITFELTRTK
jgi:hypothetical protein